MDDIKDIYLCISCKTDKNDLWWWRENIVWKRYTNFRLIPDQGLHHELELLQEAGINPYEIIKIATVNGTDAQNIE
jgi:hypothetical protein